MHVSPRPTPSGTRVTTTGATATSLAWRVLLLAVVAVLLAGCTVAISGSGAPATVITTDTVTTDTTDAPGLGSDSTGGFQGTADPQTPPPFAGGSPNATIPQTSTSTSTPVPTMPTGVDVTEYLLEMTDSLLAQDREAFLAYFVGAAEQKATVWWDNMVAIGMDGGAVSTWFSSGRVKLNSDAAGTLNDVYLGGHFPGDGVDANGDLKISSTLYDWDVHALLDDQLEPIGIEITGWRSVSRAPWDCDCALYVARGASGVVASLPGEEGLADRVLAAQDQANSWIASFLALSAPQITMTGQVATFVTFDDDLLYGWFNPEDAVADPNVRDDFAAAVYPTFSYYGAHDDIAYNVAGTEPRMVVGAGLMSFADPVELMVHELVHYHWDKYQTEDFHPSYQPYIAEGLAQMFEQIYYATDAESAAVGAWVVGTPNQMWGTSYDQIETLFTGELPTASALRTGTPEEINFWYDISSSTYNYVAVNYGMPAAIETSVCAYEKGTVLGCIADPGSPSGFRDEATETTAWAAWVRDRYGY